MFHPISSYVIPYILRNSIYRSIYVTPIIQFQKLTCIYIQYMYSILVHLCIYKSYLRPKIHYTYTYVSIHQKFTSKYIILYPH